MDLGNFRGFGGFGYCLLPRKNKGNVKWRKGAMKGKKRLRVAKNSIKWSKVANIRRTQ